MVTLTKPDTAGLKLVFSGRPDGRVLVFGNSLGSDISLWDEQASALAASFRIARFDFPGHGAAAFWPAQSVAGVAEALVRALEEAGVEQFCYCGISMGGAVGMELALAMPDRLSALVLSNTAAEFGSAGFWTSRMEQARAHGLPSLSEATVARWLSPAHRAADPDLFRRLCAMFEQTGLEGYLQGCRLVRDFDVRGRLDRITTPTLVIAGSSDLATPPAQSLALVSQIPHSRYLELDASHLAHLGQPSAFNNAVADFLDTSFEPIHV
ncbi:MAG: alpha/beta fold hydrolase [Polaromonas sp.]|nr:alpha/beta fold hydrolase [Polaromonas sp.]